MSRYSPESTSFLVLPSLKRNETGLPQDVDTLRSCLSRSAQAAVSHDLKSFQHIPDELSVYDQRHRHEVVYGASATNGSVGGCTRWYFQHLTTRVYSTMIRESGKTTYPS